MNNNVCSRFLAIFILIAGLGERSFGAPIPTDVLVVGGGIAGVSTANFLKDYLSKGTRVTVVRPIAGNRATALSNGTFYPPGEALQTSSKDPSFAQHRMLIRSANYFRTLQEQGKPIGYVKSGSVEIATNLREEKYLRDEQLKLKDYPENLLLTDQAQMRALDPGFDPTGVRAALFLPHAGYVDAAQLNAVLEEEAEKKGALFVDGAVEEITKVIESKPSGGARAGRLFPNPDFCADHAQPEQAPRYLVRTKDQEFETEVLVVAVGDETSLFADKLGIEVPGVAVRGQMAVVEKKKVGKVPAPQRIFMTAGLHSTGGFLTHDSETGKRLAHHWYHRPCSAEAGEKSRGTLFGGGRQVSAPRDYTTDAVALAEEVSSGAQFFPGLEPPRGGKVEGYSCRMPFSGAKDRRPLVGKLGLPGMEGVYLAAGFGSQGIMLGPEATHVLAKEIATVSFGERDLLEPGDQEVLKALDPLRENSGVKAKDASL